jgi:hypothetical protein
LNASPFSRFLGLKLIGADRATQSVAIAMQMRPELERLQEPGSSTVARSRA